MNTYKPVYIAYNTFKPKSREDENMAPIIFLHGLAECKEMWEEIPQNIANRTGRICYSLDTRDHGDSEYTEDFTYEFLINDLDVFIDSKKLPKVILIGHSLGGWTSYRYALRKPQKVEMLIVEDFYVGPISKRDYFLAQTFSTIWIYAVENIPKGITLEEGIRFAVDFFYDKIPQEKHKLLPRKEVFYKTHLPIKRLDDGSFLLNLNKDQLDKFGEEYDRHLTPATGTYYGPTYLIYGSLSIMFKRDKHEKSLQKHFPNIQFIMFEGATHLVHLELPEKFTETVLQIILQRSKSKI